MKFFKNLRTVLAYLLIIIITVIFGFNEDFEKLLHELFQIYKIKIVDVSFNLLLVLTFFGIFLYIASIIGRFEEHKIDPSTTNMYNSVLNFLIQLSGVTPIFFFYLVCLLLINYSCTDSTITYNLYTIIYKLIIITYFYIFFLVIKTTILEKIMDEKKINDYLDSFGFNDSVKKFLSE